MDDTNDINFETLCNELESLSKSNKSLLKVINENQVKLHSELIRTQEYGADIAQMLIPLLKGEDKEIAQIKLSDMVSSKVRSQITFCKTKIFYFF